MHAEHVYMHAEHVYMHAEHVYMHVARSAKHLLSLTLMNATPTKLTLNQYALQSNT